MSHSTTVACSSTGPQVAKRNGVFQFKIQLEKMKPPLWRRVLVPESFSLDQLHQVILCLFGWDGNHLHMFNFPETEMAWSKNTLERKKIERKPIRQLFQVGTKPIIYTYDFGPNWTHYISVEAVLPKKDGDSYPKCIAGRRVNLVEYPEEDEEEHDVTSKFKPAEVDFSRMSR